MKDITAKVIYIEICVVKLISWVTRKKRVNMYGIPNQKLHDNIIQTIFFLIAHSFLAWFLFANHKSSAEADSDKFSFNPKTKSNLSAFFSNVIFAYCMHKIFSSSFRIQVSLIWLWVVDFVHHIFKIMLCRNLSS